MHHKTPTMVGESARNIDAARRRQPGDQRANAGKLTIV